MTTHPEGLLQKLNVDDKRVDNQRLIIIDDLMSETNDRVVNLFSLAWLGLVTLHLLHTTASH